MAWPFLIFVFGLLLFTTAIIYYFVTEKYAAIIHTGLFLLITLGYYLKAARIIFKWKSEIRTFLDHESKFERYSLVLTDTSITVVQDDRETILQWASFESASITKEFIHLEGKIDLIIPSKALNAEDYQILRLSVSEKIGS